MRWIENRAIGCGPHCICVHQSHSRPDSTRRSRCARACLRRVGYRCRTQKFHMLHRSCPVPQFILSVTVLIHKMFATHTVKISMWRKNSTGSLLSPVDKCTVDPSMTTNCCPSTEWTRAFRMWYFLLLPCPSFCTRHSLAAHFPTPHCRVQNFCGTLHSRCTAARTTIATWPPLLMYSWLARCGRRRL